LGRLTTAEATGAEREAFFGVCRDLPSAAAYMAAAIAQFISSEMVNVIETHCRIRMIAKVR
jgi:hypothetical protein